MKYICAFALLLIIAVPTVQAQDCSIINTLPAHIQSYYSSNKPLSIAGTNAAITTSDLSIERQFACSTDKSFTTSEQANADNPFYSALDELWLDNAWVNSSLLENEYDDDDRLIRKALLRWNPNLQEFVDETVTLYTQDPNENSVEVLTKTWDGTAFQNQYKDVFVRDSFGNQTLIDRSDWESGAWQTKFLSTAVVVDGLIVERTIQTTNAQGVLANSRHLTLEYDGEGRQIVETEERWDENSQSWTLESRDLTSYSGSTAVTISQMYFGNWVDFTELTELYDDNGLVIEYTSVSLRGTVEGSRFLYSYDDAGNLTELIYQIENDAGEWINQSRNAFTLDQDGDPLVLLIQVYDTDSMAWVSFNRISYNYHQDVEATGVEEEMIFGLASFDVYPYPAKDRVHVALQLTQTANLQVEVFDVLGRRVKDLSEGMEPAGAKQFSWSPQDEPAGLYFIRLSVDGAVETRPIVLVK